MSKLKTPYACSICKKEFCNAVFLVKHVELRHRTSNQSSTFSNKDVETSKIYSISDIQGNSSNSKNHNKKSNNQPYIIKIEENETFDEEHHITNR